VDPATIPMHWTWTATAGATKTIPYINTFEDIQIDWGDGSAVEMIFDGENDNLTHTYTTAGNYTVTILNPQPITELYLGISSLMAMAMGKDATANQNITDFRAGQAHNIQTLTLGNNQLSAFAEGALRGLGGVQIIDLGNNTFSSFNAEAIDELGSLFALVLSNNQLTTYPDIPFDKFQQLIITFDHNRLKTLPTEYAATIDPMYNTLYLAENCIDRTSEEEVVYGDILDYRDDNLGFPARWRDQHLCASVSYDPPEIDGITTGNVLASVIFNGPTVKKTDFFTANPGLETDHTFTQNGSYLFDYSSAIGATVLIDPVDGLLPATVTRIDKGMPEVISTIYVPSGIPGGPIVVTLIINKTVLPIP